MTSFKNCNIMKRNRSNIPRMKRKVCGLHLFDFTTDEHEAADALVLLQTPFQKKQIITKLKIKIGGKRVCQQRIYNNIVHSTPHINVPNVVMGNANNLPNVPTIPGVPNNNILECCKPFEKKLYKSDLKVDLNRLFLDKNHVEEYFLPLLKQGEDIVEGIDVDVYDMQGKTFKMKFKCWSNKFYNLNGGWKNFFKAHSLVANQDHVTVWMFRHLETDKLCFALSVRRV